jgi:hypothetical protein
VRTTIGFSPTNTKPHTITNMARRRNRRRTNMNRMQQKLQHPFSQVSAAANATTVPASAVGVISQRPARPVSLQLTFMSAVARSFIFTVSAANKEEIFRSPTLLSGPIPTTRSFRLPRSTDFAFYDGTEVVVLFQHATNPAINWVCNMQFEYNNTKPETYF